MIQKMKKDDSEALSAMKAGIAEANRRSSGDFDGLIGSLPKGGSLLLETLIFELRDVLLNRYSDQDARELIAEYAPMQGYRNVGTVPDDIELALHLLSLIASTLNCETEHRAKLFLGKRDAARQAGTRKERRPEITFWIKKKLTADPSLKSPELWKIAPSSITDTIAYDRFTKRVTAARKELIIGRK